MVYIYKKKIGNKTYYYLRASVRKQERVIAKDIKFLGNDIEAVRDNLQSIPKQYESEIRKTYKTISRFLEANTYLEKAKELKLKQQEQLSKDSLLEIEACRLHWQQKFKKLNPLTQEETISQFIVEFAFNTTGIEGNTITLKQAHELLHEERTPKNKSLREIYDLQNTQKAFLDIFHGNKKIDHDRIRKLHALLMEQIDTRTGYRTEDVRVFRAQFKATPAPYVKADMDMLLDWLKKNEQAMHPLVLAIVFHHKFEKIHPFMDGNGRTGRILMNSILLNQEYPPIIIRKRNRTTYLDHLSKADKCPITESKPEYYRQLVDFSAKEMAHSYWNIFI